MNVLTITLTIFFAMAGLSHAQMPTEPPHSKDKMPAEPAPDAAATGKKHKKIGKKAKSVKAQKNKKNDEILMPVEPPVETTQKKSPAQNE